MDKVNQKMKKFNLGRVLVGLRSSVSTPQKADVGIDESLRSEHFQIAKTVRHGFPFQPTALACDPVQNLLAIGTRNGSLKIFGQPGVECDVRHDGNYAVIQLMFLVNEGALVSVTADDQVHMWTLRQKKPEIVHSLKFQRERITFCHLPFQSKWLHIGTEKGNVHVVSLETFTLSGYVINWNKAMELIRLAHPGPIVHLSDCPMDPNKLLIGFETGAVVLWDLKNKVADARFTCTETLKSACWHQDGKQFICSHGDGSLTVWNCKLPQRPQSFMMPHAKLAKDNKPELCKAISKVDYRSVRNGEPYIIFSGGTPSASQMPSLTLMHGNKMTVLEMEHPVVDFFTLCCTPWNNDFQDPNAIVVLLEKDLVVVDLNTEGFPCFENPYPMDIHESPVTACSYYADCPPDLVPAFYSVGCKRKRTGYSDKEWPIHGGEWTTPNCSYPEIIITGHADGSVKIWDASSVTLQVLYKLKTAKVFDPTKCKSLDDDDSPFAIQHIYLCVDSRLLCIAGLGHVVLFRFSKQELSLDCPVLEISIVYEIYDGVDTPDEFPIILPKQPLSRQSGSAGSYSNLVSNGKEPVTSVRAKTGVRKWPPGYQPDLCCLLTWIDNEPPPPITSLSVNSRFGLLAFGDECGIAIIDIIQKTCLLSMGTPDLYGSMDPYSRAPRSPKLKTQPKLSAFDLSSQALSDDCRSPTVEQTSDKTDSPFSRSHSSSTASLENVNKEAIECLVFADAYTRKSDTATCPCLWVGTSLGTVLVISLTLPSDNETRRREPVIISPSGTIFRLKGSILAMSFLDCNGILIPTIAEQWKDTNREKEEKEKRSYNRQASSANVKSRISPTSSVEMTVDRQFAIICSEKQARVISLPSQTCIYKVKVTETSCVSRADVIAFKDSVCLSCYIANGHIIVFSLPSLKPLLDVDYIPFPDVRVARTICFSSYGHIIYMCSASEIQKLTLSAETCENLKEAVGDLFLPCNMPEAPKQNFFKNLFTGPQAVVDREELFGENSGKASKGLTKYTPGPAGLAQDASYANSEIGRAKLAALERGEKLGELEERTERLKMDAEIYSQSAHQLKMKYKAKKWWQF